MRNEYLIQVHGIDCNQALQVILKHEDVDFTTAVGAGGLVICIHGKDRKRVNKAIAEWKFAMQKMPDTV